MIHMRVVWRTAELAKRLFGQHSSAKFGRERGTTSEFMINLKESEIVELRQRLCELSTVHPRNALKIPPLATSDASMNNSVFRKIQLGGDPN